MEYNMNEVTELGSLFFTIEEVALMLEISINEFIDKESKYYQAYHKGFLNSEKELRAEMVETAKNGSPAAQESILKTINSTKSANSIHG